MRRTLSLIILAVLAQAIVLAAFIKAIESLPPDGHVARTGAIIEYQTNPHTQLRP